MSEPVYRICRLLTQVLAAVPVGSSLGLLHLLLALVSGRFLAARGAVFPALSEAGLAPEAVRRAACALPYGRWRTADLLPAWGRAVLAEGRWRPQAHAGFRPVAVDLTGFFRPRLVGCVGKHDQGEAGKALPAVVFALVAPVGSVGTQRLALPRRLLRQEAGETEAALQRQEAGETEAALQRRAVRETCAALAPDEAAVCDAGFALSDLLRGEGHFVGRLPTLWGGCPGTPRPAATPSPPAKAGADPRCGGSGCGSCRGRTRTTHSPLPHPTPRRAGTRGGTRYALTSGAAWSCLTPNPVRPASGWWLSSPRATKGRCFWRVTCRCRPMPCGGCAGTGGPSSRCPSPPNRCRQTDAAKQMLGCERAFVHGQESRCRLPELALLAGSVLSHVAATSQPVASGLWDKAARPTRGRLRRALGRAGP